MRILLVEDDRMIAEAVRKGLRGEGGFRTEVGFILDYWFE